MSKVNEPLKIEIKYHTSQPELEFINGVSDWVDLRVSENIVMVKGDYRLIDLGISMKLPEGYEAHIAPRSSTFKNFGIICVNSIGIIDNSYSGDDDVWKFPALAMRNTIIHKGDRICQFRVVKKQPDIEFVEVSHLKGKNRGGIGSTGVD